MKKIITSFLGIASISLSSCDTLKDLTTASNNKPVINSFDHSPKELNNKDEKIIFTVVASDRDKKDTLEYKWSSTKGTLSTNTGETVNWSPLKSNGECDFQSSEGIAVISVLVSDGNGGTTTGQTNIRVEKACKTGGSVGNSTVVNTTKPVESASSSATPTPTQLATSTPLTTIVATPTPLVTPIPTATPILATSVIPTPMPIEIISPSVAPTTATTKPAYVPAKISFNKLEIKERNGNGDNIANRGETITIKSYFTNSGGANSNQLKIVASSTSEFVTITNSEYEFLAVLKPNENKSAYYGFTLEISKTIPAGTEIPLLYKLSDDFGNEYSTTGSFIVQ